MYSKLDKKSLSKGTVTMPACGHEVILPPNANLKEVSCTVPCKIRVDKCGHSCVRLCHVDDDPDHVNYICKKPCSKARQGCTAGMMGDRGDHQCRKQCHEACDRCDVPVTKIIPVCKHDIQIKCHKVPTPDLCESVCNRTMTCGHVCKGLCGKPCDVTQCTEPSLRKFPSPCGHSVSLPCNMAASTPVSDLKSELLVKHCKELCRKELSCGHVCRGTCSECRSGRLHVPCQEPCNRLNNFCGHACQEPCSQSCPPCVRRCEVQCPHSRCGRTCGEPCVPCQEPCTRRCVHGACIRRCSEPCSIAACDASCPLRLRCGHACRGLCGEPCPDICRQCRAGDFPTGFLGEEFDAKARFIQLQDCGHVLEVGDYDNLIRSESDTVQYRACPYCRKPIINANRLKGIINKIFEKEINPLKERLYGTKSQVDDLLNELVNKCDKFEEAYDFFDFSANANEQKIWTAFDNLDSAIGRQTKVTLTLIEMEHIYFNIINNTAECYNAYLKTNSNHFKDEISNVIDLILTDLYIQFEPVVALKITPQQQEDMYKEIRRLNFIVNFAKLMNNEAYLYAKNRPDWQHRDAEETAVSAIFCLSRFNETEAEDVFARLQKILRGPGVVMKQERDMVVKAVGLKGGHWFKCPNGHFYCVSDCGGPVVVSKCADCNAAIGGVNNTLLSDNAHAPEMDGSSAPAWPTAVNNTMGRNHAANAYNRSGKVQSFTVERSVK